MSILTVGSGKEYATIAAAVAAAQAGDTIDVNAGTYTVADLTITQNLTLVAVGGTVDIVAPAAVKNSNVSKGLFVIGNATSAPDVTIDGFSFSGAKSAQSNGAGIRYQSGNLTLNDDSFVNNQDGILATPFVYGTGTIDANDSVFDHNGAGDGQSHNIYIGYINAFVMTNSVSEDAVVGHEVKSRAENNTIENNLITDGSTGTASYSIDLPDGGNDIVQGNTFVKGPDASSPIAIHVGGPELQWADSNVLIDDNTFVNNYGAAATVVENQSTALVSLIDNTVGGFDKLLNGIGTQSGNVNSSGGTIAASTSSIPPSTTTINLSATSGNQSVTLTRPYYTVVGGRGLLTVIEDNTHETVQGGSGGVAVSGDGAQTVYTEAGSSNTIQASSGGDVYYSYGHDSITVAFGGGSDYDIYGTANVTGTATSGASENTFISGIDNFDMRGGSENVYIRPGGTATIDGIASYVYTSETYGQETFDFTLSKTSASLAGSFVAGDVEMTNGSVTVYQSADRATLDLTQGTFNISDYGGSTISGSGANVYVSEMGGLGLTFIGGSGSATIVTNSGGATISIGSGTLTVDEHTRDGAVTYDFNHAIGDGSVTINDFRPGEDSFAYSGFTDNPIASETVSAGSLHLTLQNHTTVILEHVTNL